MTMVRRQTSDENVTTPPSPSIDEGLARAATRFFPDATSVESAAGRAHLVRVETPSGTWAVRRWPAGTPQERVDFVHEVLRESRAAGIDFVPDVTVAASDGSTVLALDGRLYDAESWLPGRAPLRGPDLLDERGRGINRPSPLSAATLMSAVRAIATWHGSTESLAARENVPQAPLDAALRAVRASWEEQRQRLRPLAPRTTHIQRWIRTGEVVLAAATEALAGADFLRSRPTVVGHLNLWPAHLLVSRFEGQERITGMLDFAESAASSPLIDLAQLISHFNGWTGAAAEDAIGAYADVRTLAPEERRLLPAVAGLDLVAETGRLLTLGYATRAIVESGGGDTIRAGAASLLLSLEAIAPAVQRGDRPEPSKARKWEYGPRRSGPAARRRPGSPAGPKPSRSSSGRSERRDTPVKPGRDNR